MNNTGKIVIISAGLILVLGGSYFAYRKFRTPKTDEIMQLVSDLHGGIPQDEYNSAYDTIDSMTPQEKRDLYKIFSYRAKDKEITPEMMRKFDTISTKYNIFT